MSVAISIGAHTLPYRPVSLQRALEGIASAGFTSLGLWRDHEGRPLLPSPPTPGAIAELRKTIDSAGLTPVALFAGSDSMRDRHALLDDLRVCSGLGIGLLQAAGPWPLDKDRKRKPEMQWYGEVEHFLSHLHLAAREAEQAGVTVVLKPHGGVTGTGRDLVSLLHRVDSPWVRACWDAGNVRFYEGLDSEDDLEQSGVAPLVKSVCIKDHLGPAGDPRFPIPGEGDVDHPRMLRTLVAAGFDGPLLVERVDQPDLETTDAALARACRYLQSTMSAVYGERGVAQA